MILSKIASKLLYFTRLIKSSHSRVLERHAKKFLGIRYHLFAFSFTIVICPFCITKTAFLSLMRSFEPGESLLILLYNQELMLKSY